MTWTTISCACCECSTSFVSTFGLAWRRAAQAIRRRPQRGARGSYVPDHVRNPGKYTCYALDEPLIIGSGGGGGGDALGDAEQARAFCPRLELGCSYASMCIAWQMLCS